MAGSVNRLTMGGLALSIGLCFVVRSAVVAAHGQHEHLLSRRECASRYTIVRNRDTYATQQFHRPIRKHVIELRRPRCSLTRTRNFRTNFLSFLFFLPNISFWQTKERSFNFVCSHGSKLEFRPSDDYAPVDTIEFLSKWKFFSIVQRILKTISFKSEFELAWISKVIFEKTIVPNVQFQFIFVFELQSRGDDYRTWSRKTKKILSTPLTRALQIGAEEFRTFLGNLSPICDFHV